MDSREGGNGLKAFASRKIAVNGISMNVVVAGNGPPLLLVHGYPDSHDVWRHQIPALVAAGYRVIAPDTRGCGDTDMSPNVADYRVDNLVADLIALLDVLRIDKVRLVAHDWGAAMCWQLVLKHPERVERYIPMSVGHPNAYAAGGVEQKLKGYYILLIQLRGFAEWFARAFDWFGFRLLTHYPPETDNWIARQSRPGRLTAGMNYYRANLHMIFAKAAPSATVPVYGLWSSGDSFLAEKQMIASEKFVAAPWRYSRIEGATHWMQLDAPEKVNAVLLDYLR